MATSVKVEDDYISTDPAGVANTTNRSEPLATKADDLSIEEDDASNEGTTVENIVKRPNLELTKSYATSASGLSDTASLVAEPEKKKWYQKLNPLRWSAATPVPKEREVSKEYGASFFSILVFQWMAPLMTVCEI